MFCFSFPGYFIYVLKLVENMSYVQLQCDTIVWYGRLCLGWPEAETLICPIHRSWLGYWNVFNCFVSYSNVQYNPLYWLPLLSLLTRYPAVTGKFIVLWVIPWSLSKFFLKNCSCNSVLPFLDMKYRSFYSVCSVVLLYICSIIIILNFYFSLKYTAFTTVWCFFVSI